mmetsp:Transcript_15950/g.17707  ORF Transcript_15950/g.17707 Transcript_15950/m.17707 type:complete len:140 (-) Transcript_15950:27-446(-)
MWSQQTVKMPRLGRGCHLVTEEICKRVPQIKEYKVGLLNLFLQHTSAALSLNENWDKDVRLDMADIVDTIVPESKSYRHSCEGPDDMPAHVKSSLFGANITIPITDGKLNLGTWQGIYLCEFRNGTRSRTIIATIQGQK